MIFYFDSSALVAVYVTEGCSQVVRREIRAHSSVPWTRFHDLEVRNALRLLHGRGQIEAGELEALLEHIDDDLSSGRLARPPTDLGAVFLRAEELSRRWASETLARSLDILHVAALLEIGCTTLLSGDHRQIAVAKCEGIACIDIQGG